MTADLVLVLNAGSSSIKAALQSCDDAGTITSLWHDQQSRTLPADAAVDQCLAPWLPAESTTAGRATGM